MAQPLHAVWLEPEEQHEPTSVQVRPRRTGRPAPAVWQRSVAAVVAVAFIVGLLIVYVGGNARIAQYAMKRRALQQELANLNRECVQLNLELDYLATQPQVTRVAQAQGLELPGANRVHYVRLTSDVSHSDVASAPPAAERSWLARSGRQMVATVDSALQRLSRGPGAPAYAQE